MNLRNLSHQLLWSSWAPTLLAWLTRVSFSFFSPPYPALRHFQQPIMLPSTAPSLSLPRRQKEGFCGWWQMMTFQEAESWSTWGSNSSPESVVGWTASFVYCFMEVNESERQDVLQDVPWTSLQAPVFAEVVFVTLSCRSAKRKEAGFA